MSEPLACAPNPCSACPYRRDVPPGIWDASEYAKLPGYDEGGMNLGVFLCHQLHVTGREMVCRGWLTVAADSIAVRFALITGRITPEQRDAPVGVPLYETGAEAADAGMGGVERPSPEACRVIQKMERKRGLKQWRPEDDGG